MSPLRYTGVLFLINFIKPILIRKSEIVSRVSPLRVKMILERRPGFIPN